MRSISIALGVLISAVATPMRAEVEFNRDVRPILSDRCFHCHGPDANDRQAGLRLDQAGGEQGAHAFAIEPGSPDNSELWMRITSEDPDLVMPPSDSHKKPMTPSEKEIMKQWISRGAIYEPFWAFVPPEKPGLPTGVTGAPIDRLVRQRLEAEGLSPASQADRRTLIRRLTFDLTGLPPTRQEIHDFLDDDSPDAYEKVVDRLLNSPHYGEHMAKYWLDLVRFADTNGIHHDHYREMSPYRDWVIRAFNDNLRYDQFIRFQLAGDLYPTPSRDQLIASGFNRLHLIIDRGTALPEESYTRNVIDRVTSVGTAFMGMTVQCAVCHDHKYDPITTQDFYSLFAFFNNLDADPETGPRRGTDFQRGLQPPYINLTTTDQAIRLSELNAEIEAAQTELASLKGALQRSSAEEAEQQNIESLVEKAEQRLKAAQSKRDDYLLSIPAAMVMKERAESRPAFVLIRGAYDNPGEQVTRETPGFLPPMESSEGEATRMDLANWLVDPKHPLTARVTVNRFWQQFFGTGIVKTAEDFGLQGESPSHPDLLDYLSVGFVKSGWDVKELLKEIVMSETYRQSSVTSPEAHEQDPNNRLLARGSRYRMDSEMIRDQLLATSGLLNTELFGKSVKPPQPDGLWRAVSMPSSYPKEYVPDSGGDVYRRSIYTFWKRGMPPPQMTIFNAPSREECIARRERTNTPLQALLLMNEVEYLKAARRLASRILSSSTVSTPEKIEAMYETITSQQPGTEERTAFAKLLADLTELYGESPELAEKLCENHVAPAGVSSAEWAAWTMLASTIYNLDITKTRQ